MPNTGVEGVVRNELGQPIVGLGVRVRVSAGTGRNAIVAVARWVAGGLESSIVPRLGEARTAADGSFAIHYAALDEPDLDVVLFTGTGRRLDVHSATGVIDQTLDLGTWTVPSSAFGWAATTGSFTPTDGSTVEVLIDNHLAWSRALDAVDKARTSINFMLFYLDIGASFMKFDPDPPQDAGLGPTQGRRMEGALESAADRGVTVRLLLNDLAGVPYPLDTAGLVEDHFAGTKNVETRRFTNFPVAPVHAKVLVVDDTTAYELGSPFVQDYYDDVQHSLHDPRHGEDRCSKAIKVPTHDVSACIRGPAVGDMNETFRLHWNQAKPSGEADLPVAAAPPPQNDGMTVHVTRSLWGAKKFTALPDGETSILESYLRAIERATKYIYLENQYFTLRELAEALIESLKARPALQLILLTNNAVDIPFYGYRLIHWHADNVSRLLHDVPAARNQVGVFTRWSHEAGLTAKAPDRVGRNYVHSKVAVIDDIWATIGSANLDGVSLLASEHAVRTPIGAFIPNDEEIRETDVNLVIFDRQAGGNADTTLPADLRKRLWAEHLGFLTAQGDPDPGVAEVQAPPGGGWLDLWRQRATANLDALRKRTGPHPARIMPWPHQDGITIDDVGNPRRYLAAFGIAPTVQGQNQPAFDFEVLDTFDYYSFAEDRWEE